MKQRNRFLFFVAVLGSTVFETSPLHAQATDLDGSIMTSQWLALGPFASKEKAAQALAKLQGEGYRDALIQTAE